MQDAHDRMGGSKKPSSGHREHHKKHKIKWAHFERMLPVKPVPGMPSVAGGRKYIKHSSKK